LGLTSRLGQDRRADLAEWLVLASGALLLVPGIAGVLVWPWLWFVPGLFVTRRTLGLSYRSCELYAVAAGASAAIGAVTPIPAALVLGRLRAGATVASIIACAAASAWLRPRATDGASHRPSPATLSPLPHPFVLALVGLWCAARIVAAVSTPEPRVGHSDAPYFVGMVRALADGMPPRQYSAFPTPLKQPWGYWLVYAVAHVLSRCDIATTLGLSSAFAGAGLLAAVHALGARLGRIVARPRLVAGLATLLALGASDAGWIASALAGARNVARLAADPSASFAGTLWHAFYDAPALLLGVLLLVLYDEHRATGAARPALAMAALAAVLPFFHVVYALEFGACWALVLALDARRARPSRWLLPMLLTPLPFYVGFVWLFAHGVPARAPFLPYFVTPDLFAYELARHASFYVRYTGTYLPFALAGVSVLGGAGMAASALVLVPTLLALFTANLATNYHWEYDPLALGLVLTSAVALGRLHARAPMLGMSLGALLCGLGLVGARYDALFGRPAGTERPEASADQRALASWIALHAPPDALFVVAAGAVGSIEAVLGLAERPVFFGHAYQLDRTIDADALRVRLAANAEMLGDPQSPLMRANGVRFIVRGKDDTRGAAWRAQRTPLYESASFELYDATGASPR
jgi:hypothetical protein